MEEAFRDAMAQLAAGVVVVCAPYGPGYRALAATSFTSVSLEEKIVNTITAANDSLVVE